MDSMSLGLSDDEMPNDHSVEVENAISGIPDPDSSEPDRLPIVSNVLVTSSSSNFNDQDSLRATRIIIHDPSAFNILNGTQTITFNPLNRSLSVPEKNINWDPSVYDPVLTVRCRNIKGELHKSRFGSGSRGRSILVNGNWHTPSEFEHLCGRGNSKDWKRSIRYAGRTLMCLIDEGILRPHATSCTCANCCDDNYDVTTVQTPDTPTPTQNPSSGPIRLFTPYKRRRRNTPKLKVVTKHAKTLAVTKADTIASAPIDLNDGVATAESHSLTGPFVPTNPSSCVISALPESVIVNPTTPQVPRLPPTALDFNEHKQWWHLEEMVKNAVRTVLELQKQVETVKAECAVAREGALKELRTHMEKDKKEALSNCRMEAQLALNKAISDAKREKESAVEKAIQETRREMQEKFNSIPEEPTDPTKSCANCGREADSECAACHQVSYCSPFCHRKDWPYHRDKCGESALTGDDCSDVEDDPNS